MTEPLNIPITYVAVADNRLPEVHFKHSPQDSIGAEFYITSTEGEAAVFTLLGERIRAEITRTAAVEVVVTYRGASFPRSVEAQQFNGGSSVHHGIYSITCLDANGGIHQFSGEPASPPSNAEMPKAYRVGGIDPVPEPQVAEHRDEFKAAHTIADFDAELAQVRTLSRNEQIEYMRALAATDTPIPLRFWAAILGIDLPTMIGQAGTSTEGPMANLRRLIEATSDTKSAPLPVKGYTPQSKGNMALVDRNKEIEERLLRILDELKEVPGVDQRWLATGRTDIEKGLMAVNRSIFKPTRVRLPEDMARFQRVLECIAESKLSSSAAAARVVISPFTGDNLAASLDAMINAGFGKGAIVLVMTQDDFAAAKAEPEFDGWFDPVTNYQTLMSGMVGYMLGIEVMVDPREGSTVVTETALVYVED